MAIEHKKLRGITLLTAVFGELSQHLPEGAISTEELLEAAQKLIELSKNEYVTTTEREVQRHQGYYSYDLCTAFEKFQWRILETETKLQSESLSSSGWRWGLKELLNGSRDDMMLGDING